MSQLKKELISEFMGTFILILFGSGVVAMTCVFGADTKGGYINITLAWGLAVTMGIYASQYSGAHLNPAVTLALAVTKRFSWSKVLPFILVQTVAAFIAAGLVYIEYYIPMRTTDPTLSHSAGIFTTFPTIKDNFLPGLYDQILGTFLLLFMILAIGDTLKKANAGWLGPILVGLIVVAIGMSFGGMHGYAINPARDFGPRLMTAVAGFQNTGFGSLEFLVPIVGPFIGGVLGAVVYDKTLGAIEKR